MVEFDRVGWFGRDVGDVTSSTAREGSAAGTVASCGGWSFGAGGVVRTLPGGTMVGGALPGGAGLGKTGLGGACPVVAGAACGALGRGT